MAITKKISTALYVPLVANYRYKGNIIEVRLPSRALNVDIDFADENAFNEFADSVKHLKDKELIFFDKVKNANAVENTAEKNTKKTLDKVSAKVDSAIANSNNAMAFKNAKIETTTQKG